VIRARTKYRGIFMRKWLYDNPWIWVVVFLSLLMAGSIATLIIAELNRPEIVKI
jgi:hypothetical protein